MTTVKAMKLYTLIVTKGVSETHNLKSWYGFDAGMAYDRAVSDGYTPRGVFSVKDQAPAREKPAKEGS